MRQNVAVLPIGETLREQRIRAKVDMSEVEETTKIRAKYLRALENEEFDVLPGGAYVKSFLKTYADYLGLDARLLLDAYRTQFEQNDDQEAPIFPRHGEAPDNPGGRRLVVLAVVLVVFVLIGLGLLGLRSDGKGDQDPQGSDQTAQPTTRSLTGDEDSVSRAYKRTDISLQASKPVFICLQDQAGNRIIDGRIVLASTQPRRYQGQGELSLRVGRGGVTVRSGAASRRIGSNEDEQAFTIKRDAITPLALEKAPSCQ